MGASIKYNFGVGHKKGYTYVDNFGAGQENCGCKCTHCIHKFGAIVHASFLASLVLQSIVIYKYILEYKYNVSPEILSGCPCLYLVVDQA